MDSDVHYLLLLNVPVYVKAAIFIPKNILKSALLLYFLLCICVTRWWF